MRISKTPLMDNEESIGRWALGVFWLLAIFFCLGSWALLVEIGKMVLE